MPVTTYLDPAMQVWALQTRTDETGVDIEDSSAAEGRLVWRMFTEGVKGDSYEVTAAGGSMTVVVGSGSAFTDMAVVSGDTAALGNYGVLLEPASQNVVVPAADISNPRIDQIFLVVVDDPGTLVTTRIGYRQGDAAASAPGPDSGWEGSLLLASIAVGAGVTTISQGNITDERIVSSPFDDSVSTATIRDGAVTGVKAAGGFLQSFEVDGSDQTDGTLAFTTSFVAYASVSLSIPADWGSWKCEARGRLSIQSPASGSYETRIVIDGTAQQVVGGTATDQAQVPVGGHRTGMTMTGSRTVTLQARRVGGTGGSASLRYLYARAVRTS